jgi:UDP-2,4-diacetamido-2,4,6-trideoxy-beta-L-altropyranose hydrolase
MTPRLLVRADASASIGLGHLGRAFALAEELAGRLGVMPELLARADPVLARFVDGRELRWTAIEGQGYAAAEVAARLSPGAILVSDSYELDEAGLEAAATAGARHVVIDDFASLRHWPVDLVVNPNAGSEGLEYPGAARVLAGTRYALLRREILDAARATRRTVGPAHTVLVSFGGGRWTDRGVALLEAVARELARLTIRATVSPELAPAGVEPVDPRLLHLQLAAADVALLSGGVLKYEAAVCGLPALLVALVPHQVEVAAAFAGTGAARALGPLEALDPAEAARELAALAADAPARAAMTAAARAAVDGRGAERVAETLLGPDG